MGLIPLLGDFVAVVYMIVLDVVAIWEACRISAGQAVLVFVLSVVLPWIILVFVLDHARRLRARFIWFGTVWLAGSKAHKPHPRDLGPSITARRPTSYEF